MSTSDLFHMIEILYTDELFGRLEREAHEVAKEMARLTVALEIVRAVANAPTALYRDGQHLIFPFGNDLQVSARALVGEDAEKGEGQP